MKKHLKGYGLCGLAVLGALLLVGCSDPPAGPTIIVTNNNTNTNNVGQAGAPQPGPTPVSCSATPVVRLTMGVMSGRTASGAVLGSGTKSAPVGSTLNLDITPRGPDGQPVPTLCHDLKPAVTPHGGCSISEQANAFTPNLVLTAAGPCVVSAAANGQTASDIFTVTP